MIPTRALAANSNASIAPRLAILLTVVTATFGPTAWAQQGRTQVDLRYETLRDAPDRNKTTPGNQFGEQISFENGSLSFTVVDVSIPGNNGLDVEFRRQLQVNDIVLDFRAPPIPEFPWPSRLSDWTLGLPRIEAGYDFNHGWITTDTSRPTKNCSIANRNYLAPPPGFYSPAQFPAINFWNPPRLSFPGGSSRLLTYNEGDLPAPATGGPYFWVTADMDYVSCIPTLKNNNGTGVDEQRLGAGEGFLVRRPDGTRYWFDWIALDKTSPSFTTTGVYEPSGNSYLITYYLMHATMALYPTRVEDRFGNWVIYTYSNSSTQPVKLDRIESSDGRVITIGYTGSYISTVTAGDRVWQYSYFQQGRMQMLGQVINPDGSTWQYTGVSKPSLDLTVDRPRGPCFMPQNWINTVNWDAVATNATFTNPGYSVKNPANATMDFFFSTPVLGKSGVGFDCYRTGWTVEGGVLADVLGTRSLGGKTLAVVGRKLSGPGLDEAVWRYNYQSDIGFYPVTNGTTRTKVLNPDGTLENYVFGNVHKKNDGLLLSHTVSKAGQVLRTSTSQFVVDTNGAFPKRVGYHPMVDINDYGNVYLRPQTRSAINQQATDFVWQVDATCGGGTALCLDEIGRPTKVSKSSTLTP